MIIKKAEFKTSVADPAKYQDMELPEVAFAGKSNVGKSSLINYLANNRKLAYVGKQPGKTRLINFFLVNGAFYIADLPGYGFARVSKDERRAWGNLMDGYFAATKKLRLLLLLMDIRHDPTEGDIQMVKWASHYKIPFLVVATKADKIAKSKRKPAAYKLAKLVSERAGLKESFDITFVSAAEKLGGEDLLAYMEEKLFTEDADA
ncbi:MAG: ribosome biogenesis GTP-binding protein YihA/YsxC [Christensenellaceae bacterium]|jgi:GTP-binding protein